MTVGNNKPEDEGVCTVILHVLREIPMPSENRLTAILNRKSQVRPRIRTWPARTECHCSTTCATTTARNNLILFLSVLTQNALEQLVLGRSLICISYQDTINQRNVLPILSSFAKKRVEVNKRTSWSSGYGRRLTF